ncbi:uncharacterized protein LOC144178402 isoform X2 [Haemaphysalis longicornis]
MRRGRQKSQVSVAVLALVAFILEQVESLASSNEVHSQARDRTPSVGVEAAACTRDRLSATLRLPPGFHGLVYARGYPLRCRQPSMGRDRVRISLPLGECGTRLVELQDGHLVYEAELYVQLDQHVQQAGDQALRVRCSRDALLVSGRLGRGPETKPQSSAGGSADVEGWMDILRGSMPLVKPLSGHVNVGDPMTMLIKIRHKAGLDSRVTECFAHDGSKQMEQELTDKHGCTLDPSIMADLKEQPGARATGLKVVFSSFAAFKFPDRDSLHLQCKVVVCNKTCPFESCGGATRRLRRRHTSDIGPSDVGSGYVLQDMQVYNSIQVKTSSIDVDAKGLPLVDSNHEEGAPLVCLSSSKMAAVVVLLSLVLLASLVAGGCIWLRARHRRHERLGLGGAEC